MTVSSIRERLSECTTQIMASGKRKGFGFFVAPSTVLTCAHIAREDLFRDDLPPKDFSEESLDLRVCWNNEDLPARIEFVSPKRDLALLSIELAHHPYLPLNQDIVSFDTLYTQEREPLMVKGFVGYEKIILIKGEGNHIGPGHSGIPLFNPRTEGVCGFISSGRSSEGVVEATHIKYALEIRPELASIHNSPSNIRKIFIVHEESDENLLDKWAQLLQDSNLPRFALCWNRVEEDGFGWTPPPMFNEADIIVLLVSSKHSNTDAYYRDYAQALPGKARVIQVLPPDGCDPVMGWPGWSVTFRDSAKCIREMAEVLNIVDS